MDSHTEKRLDPELWLNDYGDYLYRYAMRRVRDASLAEDLLQETLLSALKSRDSYSGRSSEKTWLVGILKHKIIDHIRKQIRESPVDDIQALSDQMNQESHALFDTRGHWIRPPADWGHPEKVLHNQQIQTAFETCLERLKSTLAQVFTLKVLMGQSSDEVCNQMDITTTNCNVMLYRARMQLRSCLESHWHDTTEQEKN
ncbi:MAG: sigma-70 family RNA polymerase sigma factor [Gammaproteobacteria bacterium]